MPLKRYARFTLHVVVALVLAAFVAVAQYAMWGWISRGQPMAEAESAISGFAYSGYGRDQSPLEDDFPTLKQLERDLDILARSTKRIRTYSSIDNVAVVPLSAKKGMRLTNGIWLDQSVEHNMREMEAGIALAKKYRHIDRLIVGNEAILREDMSPETLMLYLDAVSKATKKPVSTAEPWHIWIKYP